MKDIVIIKLYHDEVQGDWHDIQMDEVEHRIDELKKYAGQIDKCILFHNIINTDICNKSCLAEILYTGIITVEEEKYYEQFVELLTDDADITRRGRLDVFSPLEAIVYIPLPDSAKVKLRSSKTK